MVLSNEDRKNYALADLNTIRMLFEKYDGVRGQTSSTLSVQKEQLQSQLNTLISEHGLLRQAADTYDQDFLDRAGGQRTQGIHGFWAQRGISTMQDWVLFLFYVSYAAFLVICIVYTVRFSSKKLFTVGFIVFFGGAFAALFASLLLRLG